MSDFYLFEEDFGNDFVRSVNKRNIEAFDLNPIILASQELPALLRQNFIAFFTGATKNVTVGVVLAGLWVGEHSVRIIDKLELGDWAWISPQLALVVHVSLLEAGVAHPCLEPLPCH